MKLHPLWRLASLSLMTLFLAGSGCPLIPNIEEKIVELAVGASIIVPFEARGIINDKGEIECFFLSDEIDIAQILDDAGVDVSDVMAISLSGTSRRVDRPDDNADRMITNSSVDISYGDDGPEALITNFSASAGAATDWITTDLDPSGVALINQMLADLLADVQNGTDSDINGCVTWTGQSTPLEENTSFDWSIKMDITIVGEVTVDIPN